MSIAPNCGQSLMGISKPQNGREAVETRSKNDLGNAMTKKYEKLNDADQARVYSPEIQPLLQSLLSTLADIDFAFESDLDVVQSSTTDEILKRKVVGKLREQHRERREPYVRQLAALEDRIRKLAA